MYSVCFTTGSHRRSSLVLRSICLLSSLIALLLIGCSTTAPIQRGAPRKFSFPHDSFAYSNQLVWRYDFDPLTGTTTHHREVPAPTYSHHCFVMARAARQFFDNARFNPQSPVAAENTYRALVRKVLATSPRRPVPVSQQIVIPGYSNLFEFSRAHESLLKAQCGGAWQSYFQRGHWRMIFPLTRSHQARIARQLTNRIKTSYPPLAHVVRFPKLSINHALLFFDSKQTPDGVEFLACDPNDPERPVTVAFNRSQKRFSMPRTPYFVGGRVDVYEIYHSWNY